MKNNNKNLSHLFVLFFHLKEENNKTEKEI